MCANAVADQRWVKPAEERTYRRKRVRKTQMGTMLVHSATETVWSLRTRGILAGTKLEALRENTDLARRRPGTQKVTRWNGRTRHALEGQPRAAGA